MDSTETNFASFDDDARYEIHIDNDGDAKDDITYQFSFKTKVRNPNKAMPDYTEYTANTLEYREKMMSDPQANPYEAHGHAGGGTTHGDPAQPHGATTPAHAPAGAQKGAAH